MPAVRRRAPTRVRVLNQGRPLMWTRGARCRLVDMQPHRPERISAIVVAALAIGFTTWVLLTLPIQAAFILTLAAVLAWMGWIKTTYAHPVKSRRVIAV